jgi:hypothetical protein
VGVYVSLSVSPNEVDIRTALRSFLESVLPDGVDVIVGQQNRVPEPSAGSFVTMTPLRRRRIATNLDAFLRCNFTASIAGTTMTVSAVALDNELPLRTGAVFGPGLATGTAIVSQLTGPAGGTGTYRITPTQTVASEEMSEGGATFTQQTEVVYQLDVHSADVSASGDMAQTISTMFRDGYATLFFAGINPAVQPLLADDPRQMTFMNAEEQFETRWIVEARIQANQVVSGVPVQFADSATITALDIDVIFPPLSNVFILDMSVLDGPNTLG